ncbi:SPOR domain-containing protein [Cytobacillus purgationiresistens]|uniref:Stage II sporulation protein B n=1 Tax=Cytobacillus purgationiresistens TaxID=863449 RepID=A0ABU0AFF1_9BACI|nr:SPOR domain-containing protein [Cytobacillus purgationiresistens]MDQ0269984.1 stage II sporulation protein B [Cytobacillus purgationiresistens]
MDKHDGKKTITIKINGNKQSFEERDKKSETVINEEKAKRQSETEENEEFASIEAAASKETETGDNFDWILPEDGMSETNWEESVKAKQSPIKKTNKGTLLASKSARKSKSHFNFSIFFTILLAIILGTGIGIMMLNLVKAEQAGGEAQTTPVTGMQDEGKQAVAATGKEAADIQAITTYVVQGGVFSNKESADGEKKTYAEKGMPALVKDMNGNQVIFIGIADSIENAKEVGKHLENKGVNVFAKEYNIEGGTVSNLSAEEKKMLELLPQIFTDLTTVATEGMLKGKLADSTVEKLKGNEASIKGINQTKLKNENIIAVNESIIKAVEQAGAFQTSADADALTQLQQHLLSFLSVYQKISEA